MTPPAPGQEGATSATAIAGGDNSFIARFGSRRLDRRQLLGVLLFAAAIFLVALAGLILSRSTGRIAGSWLANGLAVALLIRRPADERAALFGAGVIGNFAANLASGDSLGPAVLFAILNAIEIATVLVIMARRFRPDTVFESTVVGHFLLAAVVAPVVPAIVAAGWFAIVDDMAPVQGFASWYGSDVLGLAIVAPLLLSLRRGTALPQGRRYWLEAVAIPLLGAGFATLVFAQDNRLTLFMLAPITLLAAFRLRSLAAMTTVAAIAAIAALFTVDGLGPIATYAPTPVENIYLLQGFIATMVVLVLPVIAVIGERDRLGLAWRDSERLLHRIAEASPAGIAHIDLDGGVTFVNDRWTELTGEAPRRFDDDGWLDAVHPDDRVSARSLWSRARSLHQPVSDDLRYVQPGAGVRWAELSLYPELVGGRVLGFVARLSDVSRRHEVEQELHASELLYRLLAEHGHDVIVRLDLDSTITFASSAARRLFGFDASDMIGRPFGHFVHVDDLAAFNRLLPAVNGGQGEVTAQFRQRCANAFRWVEASARMVTDATGAAPDELVASIRDIDSRRQSELLAAEAATRLRESHRLLALAEKLALVGHWRFDSLNGNFDYSTQISAIVDIPRSQSIEPLDIFSRVHPADRGKLLRTLASARRSRGSPECEVRLVLVDEVRHVRLVAQAEHDLRGQLVGMFGVMRDVTDEEITQAELIHARDEAREAARAKSNFLATMSHEIRTPMTGVLGMIDLLRMDPSHADRERYLATLKQSADLLMAVLDDILDFSRIEAGKIEFEERDFDLGGLLHLTLDLFDGAASQKGLLLSLEHDHAGPTVVRGDAVRLQQIVSNLLSNAIKFTAAGRVTVTLTSRIADEASKYWRIEVSDTGIGIAPGKLGTLFEPFVQAGAATSRRFGGTGLGLAISRRLVDAMGGKVGVRSRPGRGSTFWFELALPDGEAAVVEHLPASDPVAARALDLLVAEDNPVNQMLISALLRRFGHRVTCVENGRQAVDLAALRAFDCILMDMQMPEMDGIAATRAIRASGGPCAAIPIIALTADASVDRRRFYDGAGLTDFLTKPIDRKALGDRLAALTMPAPLAAGQAIATAPDPQPAPLTAIDLDRYNELRDVLGSSRVRDLLDLLTVELDRCPARIRELVRCGDLDGARAEAHGLKGAASNVGAVALGQVAAAIEDAMSDAHLGTKLQALDDQARRTVTAIAALR